MFVIDSGQGISFSSFSDTPAKTIIEVEYMEITDNEFDEGFESGETTALTEVEDMLVDEGFDPEEVEEMLYDPAPRKKGRKKKTSKRRYDPAPQRRYKPRSTSGKKRKTTARRKKPKGMLAKMKKFAMPGTAGVTFYASYLKRADELFTAGQITKKSVYSAVEYDVKNFDVDDALDRLKDNAGEIATPVLAAALVKETKIAGKHSGLVADILTGLAAGKAAKVLLDPPIAGAAAPARQIAQKTTQPAATGGQVIDLRNTGSNTWEV